MHLNSDIPGSFSSFCIVLTLSLDRRTSSSSSRWPLITPLHTFRSSGPAVVGKDVACAEADESAAGEGDEAFPACFCGKDCWEDASCAELAPFAEEISGPAAEDVSRAEAGEYAAFPACFEEDFWGVCKEEDVSCAELAPFAEETNRWARFWESPWEALREASCPARVVGDGFLSAEKNSGSAAEDVSSAEAGEYAAFPACFEEDFWGSCEEEDMSCAELAPFAEEIGGPAVEDLSCAGRASFKEESSSSNSFTRSCLAHVCTLSGGLFFPNQRPLYPSTSQNTNKSAALLLQYGLP